MTIIDISKRELQVKIVYYGPGRGGKTSNLEYLYKRVQEKSSTNLVSIETHGDRTLFFDFLPLDVGSIKGLKIRLNLYTVPGQPKYNMTRKLVLRGVDGVVFVADSLVLRRKHNIVSFENMKENLLMFEKNILEMPLVLQYNKRDLAVEGVNLLTIDTLNKDINPGLKYPVFEASANSGYNVFETMRKCLEITMESIRSKI